MPSTTPAGGSASGAPLTEREREILLFEASWRSRGQRKEAAVFERFGMRSSSYAALVRTILEKPEAAKVSPAAVRRLRHRRLQPGVLRSA